MFCRHKHELPDASRHDTGTLRNAVAPTLRRTGDLKRALHKGPLTITIKNARFSLDAIGPTGDSALPNMDTGERPKEQFTLFAVSYLLLDGL